MLVTLSCHSKWLFLDVYVIFVLCISCDLAEVDDGGVQHWHGQGAHGEHQGVQGKAAFIGFKMYDKIT